MWNFVNGLFPSPYAATSLREYFARGFEEFVMQNRQELRNMCPALYLKIEELYELED
jgi:Mlc titration factor MtfA (ptsG expression regulator)